MRVSMYATNKLKALFGDYHLLRPNCAVRSQALVCTFAFALHWKKRTNELKSRTWNKLHTWNEDDSNRTHAHLMWDKTFAGNDNKNQLYVAKL